MNYNSKNGKIYPFSDNYFENKHNNKITNPFYLGYMLTPSYNKKIKIKKSKYLPKSELEDIEYEPIYNFEYPESDNDDVEVIEEDYNINDEDFEIDEEMYDVDYKTYTCY